MKLQAYDAEKKTRHKISKKKSVCQSCMYELHSNARYVSGRKSGKILEFQANFGIQDIYKSLLKILEDLQKKKMFTNIFYK